MTYTEFKKSIEDLGYIICDELSSIMVRDTNLHKIIVVSKSVMYQIDNWSSAFDEIHEEDKKRTLDLAVKLASTPLEDREKYLLKVNGVAEATAYLNYSRDLEMYKFDTKNDSPRTQSEFTREEIATLPLDLRELVEQGILRKIKI